MKPCGKFSVFWRFAIKSEHPPKAKPHPDLILNLTQLRDILSHQKTRPTPKGLMANPDFDTPISTPPLPLRSAAVLIAILTDPGDITAEPHILLTLRNSDLPKHPGQVALPGGTHDPEDETLLDTALRESFEETALKPEAILHPCQLPVFISSSGFRITPYVGLADNIALTDLEANPAEVSDLFTVPLKTCLNAEAYSLIRLHHEGVLRGFYEISGSRHRLWGVTAGILHGFRTWLLSKGSPF